MKYYTLHIIANEQDRGKIELSKFDHPKVAEINVFGQRIFNNDVRTMLRSDLVVTVGNWHESKDAQKAIQVAKIMEMTILSDLRFKEYAAANYD